MLSRTLSPRAYRFGPMTSAILAVLAAAMLSACQTVPPARGVARASAAVAVEDASSPGTSIGEEAVLYNRLQAEEFVAFGAGEYPDDASGTFQAQAYARAEARRAALRELAKQIVNFGDGDQSALVAILGREEDWQGTLEASLEKRALIDYKTRDNLELARARIQGARVFTGPAPPGSAGEAAHDAGETELEFLARRRKAETLATEAAREFLYEDLLPFGATTDILGIRHAPSKTFREALREELATVPPTEVEFTDDGQCIVTLQYDRRALDRLKR